MYNTQSRVLGPPSYAEACLVFDTRYVFTSYKGGACSRGMRRTPRWLRAWCQAGWDTWRCVVHAFPPIVTPGSHVLKSIQNPQGCLERNPLFGVSILISSTCYTKHASRKRVSYTDSEWVSEWVVSEWVSEWVSESEMVGWLFVGWVSEWVGWLVS